MATYLFSLLVFLFFECQEEDVPLLASRSGWRAKYLRIVLTKPCYLCLGSPVWVRKKKMRHSRIAIVCFQVFPPTHPRRGARQGSHSWRPPFPGNLVWIRFTIYPNTVGITSKNITLHNREFIAEKPLLKLTCYISSFSHYWTTINVSIQCPWPIRSIAFDFFHLPSPCLFSAHETKGYNTMIPLPNKLL